MSAPRRRRGRHITVRPPGHFGQYVFERLRKIYDVRTMKYALRQVAIRIRVRAAAQALTVGKPASSVATAARRLKAGAGDSKQILVVH